MLPVVAITPGEPAGIGPDLAILTAQLNFNCQRVYFADPQLLADRAKQLNINISIKELGSFDAISDDKVNQMQVLPVALKTTCEPGILNPDNAAYVLTCIKLATQSQLEKHTQALMTGPIHKGVINDAGIKFSGHTEYLAELSSGSPVMMLAAEREKLRVALVTTHLPISEVSQAITREKLSRVISILHHDLQSKYAIQNPHILVCGLNPHAGENGHMGREEIDIITPVLDNFRQQGMNLSGPLPADTLFTPKHLNTADAVLAMYHDQGLPVLKHVGFGHAINITLGLPIIRTSVDHGTALDLAGSLNIDTGSYIEALTTAISLANNQQDPLSIAASV